MRLISGAHIQSPVAGPVNITISFIWSNMPLFASSFFSPCLGISSSFSSSSPSSASSSLRNARAVTNAVRWKEDAEAVVERRRVRGREGAEKRRGRRRFESAKLGFWRGEEWREEERGSCWSLNAILRSLGFGERNETKANYNRKSLGCVGRRRVFHF